MKIVSQARLFGIDILFCTTLTPSTSQENEQWFQLA